MSALKQHPGILAAALIMIFPTVLSTIFSLTFKNVAIYDMLALLVLSVPPKALPLFLPPLIPLSMLPDVLGLGLAFLIGLASYGVTYFLLGKKLGYKFKVHYFMLYYLVYSPLWLFATLWGLIIVFVRRETVEIDWKV